MKKNVLIIGGTSGIGTHFTREFSNEGWDTLFTYNSNEAAAKKLESECSAKGFRLDVTDENAMKTLSEIIEASCGKLHALIYGAGTFENSLTDKTELDSFNRVIAVNLTGAFLATKYFLPLLRKSGDGRIIYIGSGMAEAGCYGAGSYAVSKAGLMGLAKSVALENAQKNVTANVLSLGFINAGMTARLSDKVIDSTVQKLPMKRLGDPRDVAKLAVSMCADHMNYVSGQTIRINGALYV